MSWLLISSFGPNYDSVYLAALPPPPSSINRLASSTLFYSGVLLLLSTWRKVRGRDVTAGASNQNEPFCQAWKPKYAIVSGSRLAWFDSESAPAPASKPAGALGLRDGLIAVTASPPAPRDGAPRSSYISVSSADGGTTLQLGFVSPADAPAWELALRAATGDASSRSAFFASRSTADKNASGDGGTALPSVFPSLAVASNAHGSAERSSVSSEALTAQRDPAEEMELPRPGAADSLSTAALQSRIAELEAQHAAEAARRVDAERAAAAEALRAASLHTEREAARLREAKLEEELQRRSEAIAASPSRVHGGSSVVVALETPEQAADPSASQRRSEEPRVVALHDPAPSTTPMSEVHGRAARGSRPTDVATAVAEASMIAAALPLQSESGATGTVSANVPEPHSKTPTPQPLPPPPSEAAAAALLVSAAAPPLASSVLTPLDTPGVSSARSHRENGDNSSLRPVVAADWGLWTCDPDGEERVAMKRRM